MRYLLIDASPLIYAAWNSVGKLAVQSGPHKGELTGLRFQCVRSIRAYARDTGANKVVICYDTPHPVKKAEGRAEYKSNRTMTDDKRQMYEHVPALKEMISHTWWTQVEAPGYEADDLIGFFTTTLHRQGQEVIS